MVCIFSGCTGRHLQLLIHVGTFKGIIVKALFSLVSFVVAVIAWFVAAADFILAKLSDAPRPYLVPGRTFFAAYRATRAYLSGQPMNLHTFRIRDYPRYKYF